MVHGEPQHSKTSGSKHPRLKLATSAEALVALAVLLVVGMMVVPLPTVALDLLITANLAMSVLLMAAAIYLREGLALAALPTLLLLSTLYRLALNISSTRLILLQADAGQVIDAFGQFVVQGNHVVGAVVFLILTVVQFVVIARGSERVAEVGARFTLDAMPGKQLAIEADQRAGNINRAGARAARRRLERESQFYGAMDGAMKFVKGDAIASILITLINIVGGVAIGVWMRDMAAMDSLRLYGLLTIGDGLASQLPALLISTTAGLVVTRVASEEPGSTLGLDLGRQLFRDPRAVIVAAITLATLALVPGLPALPFMALATMLAVVAWWVQTRRPDDPIGPPGLEFRKAERIVCRLGAAWTDSPSHTAQDPVSPTLDDTRDDLQRWLSVRLPELQVAAAAELPARGYLFNWRGVTLLRGEAPENSSLDRSALAGLAELALREVAVRDLRLDEIQRRVDTLAQEQPALVRFGLSGPVTLELLKDVLHGLLQEGLPIEPLDALLECVAREARRGSPLPQIRAAARRTLAPRISQRLAPHGSLPVLRLAPHVEELLLDELRAQPDPDSLSLEPSLLAELEQQIHRARDGERRADVLLASARLRAPLAADLRTVCPSLQVISALELDPHVQLVTRAQLNL